MHYSRWQTYGDPLIGSGPIAIADDDWPACDVPSCDRRARAQRGGMCFRHYQRLRNTGSVEPIRHFVDNIDHDVLLGDCEICGPGIPVVRRHDGSVRCKASRRAQRLKNAYGVTVVEFDAIVEQQGGVCAICQRLPMERHGQRRLFLDHDHATGAIRSVLCGSCNIALGMIRDDPALADRLAAYLRSHQAAGLTGSSTSEGLLVGPTPADATEVSSDSTAAPSPIPAA